MNYTDDLFQILELQDQLQTKYTGGTVLHIFLGEQVNDVAAVKNLIRKVATNYRLPYFTMTPTFSICPSHGYINGEQVNCPSCHQETEVYSRVVGYLRPVKQWNNGKQAEYGDRRVYQMPYLTENREKRTEIRGRRTEVRFQMPENRSQNTEAGRSTEAAI